MAVELATAYVSIVPSARGIESLIAKELGAPVESEAKKAGEKSGDGFMTSFGKKAAAAAVAVGVAVGAAIAKGVSDAMDAERTTDRLAAQLGLGPEDAQKAGALAGKLYGNAYGESLAEVSDAVGAVMSTLTQDGTFFGDDGDIERLTAKALDLASVFDVDVSRAASSAGIAIRNGLAEDADEAFDLIVASMQRMPAEMRGELLEATDEYGTFLAGLGFTGEEAFGLLSAAARDGMYGIDKTGDALKEFTIRATDMSKTSTDAFKAMGEDAEAMALSVAAGGDSARLALGHTVESLLAMEDPVEQANAAIALFGTPLEDLNVSEIPRFLESLDGMYSTLGDVEGAAARMGDTLNDNAATKIEAFKRKAMMGLASIMAKHVIPAAEDVAEHIGDFWQKHGPGITRAAERFGGVMADVGRFLRDTVLPPLVSLGQWVARNQPVLIGLGVAIGTVLVAAFAAWAVSAGAAAAATLLALAPVIAVTAAIAALVAGVVYAYQNWDWFRDSVDAVASFFTDTLWPALKKVADFIAENFVPVVQLLAYYYTDILWPAFKKVVDFIRNDVVPAVQLIADKISDVAEFIGDKVDAIVGFFTGIGEKVSEAAGDMWGWIEDGFRSAINTVIGLWNNLRFPEYTFPKISTPLGDIGGQTVGGWSLPHIEPLAKGTGWFRGGLALVGELGPELVELPRGSRVHTAAETAGMRGNTYILNTATRDTEATVIEQFRRLELVAGFQ